MQVKGSDSHAAELQYSDDFGGTWRLLVHDVLQMMWASETELARSAAFCTQCSAPHRMHDAVGRVLHADTFGWCVCVQRRAASVCAHHQGRAQTAHPLVRPLFVATGARRSPMDRSVVGWVPHAARRYVLPCDLTTGFLHATQPHACSGSAPGRRGGTAALSCALALSRGMCPR